VCMHMKAGLPKLSLATGLALNLSALILSLSSVWTSSLEGGEWKQNDFIVVAEPKIMG